MDTLMQFNFNNLGDYTWLIVLGVVVVAIIAALSFRSRRTLITRR